MRRDVVGVVTGLSYWWPLVFDRAYFQPFSHLWSLSMEQQWYFFWPFVVMGFLWWRRGSLRALLLAILAMMLVSALSMIAWYHGVHAPTKIYIGTGPVQPLLAGAALALLLAQGWHWVDRALSSRALEQAGLGCAIGVIVFWGIVPLDHSFLFRSGYLWFAILVAVLIAAATQPKSRILGPFLALPPLRGLGVISYGVYLWHVPLYWVLTEELHLDGYSLFALGALWAILIASVSYRFIETPIRKGALPTWRKTPILAPVGVLAVGVLLFLMTAVR